jgi:hypothetical protein
VLRRGRIAIVDLSLDAASIRSVRSVTGACQLRSTHDEMILDRFDHIHLLRDGRLETRDIARGLLREGSRDLAIASPRM